MEKAVEPATGITDAQLAGMRVVVMGLGRFGGQLGVIRFLVHRGARVLVTDQAAADTLQSSLNQLGDLPLDYRLGGHDEADLSGADLLVVSPAVDRRTSVFFQAAVQAGIPWTTEINLLLERCRGAVFAVTGSVGKSTTCAMLHAILSDDTAGQEAGFERALLGGNIGRSLLDEVDGIDERTAVVLELSSFQLEALSKAAGSVRCAALTNIMPHHLQRHGTYEAYQNAKFRLFDLLTPGGVAITAAEDAGIRDRIQSKARHHNASFVEGRLAASMYPLRLPGLHNQQNAHMALKMAMSAGVSERQGRKVLAGFGGLAHRLEHVMTLDEVDFYNDSKATSPEAVRTAVAAFDRPIVLMVGGKDIGDELNHIQDLDGENVRAVIGFGEAGKRLARLLESAWGDQETSFRTIHSVAQAARTTRQIAHPGDVVLFSPGCPSYDAFVNYEERGSVFTEAVKSLVAMTQTVRQ
jgi:UDP-N-acetylmuramoylalanine--D-glutamate ligase